MKKLLACLAALLAVPSAAPAQTALDHVQDAARASDRAVYACKRDQDTKCLTEARTARGDLDDAIAILDPHADHVMPAAPLGVRVPSPSLAGAAPFVAEVPVEKGLVKAWGSGAIPGLYSSDEGAFRFTCGGDGPIAYDDPILYPAQPGKSHLHLAWGAMEFDAFLTPERLAKVSNSNCNAGPFPLNRSSYWMPAVIDDQQQVHRPDLIAVYYKRAKASSPYCTAGNPRQVGTCVDLPNGIRFIFGWDPTHPDEPAQGMAWYCTGGTGGHFTNLDDLFNSGCKAGDTLVGDLTAPDCWNGKDLDSPDHRSHMAGRQQDGYGNAKCPATHPYVIPQTENKAMWTVTADMIGTRPDGTKFSRVGLSSDAMKPGAKAGVTLHGDYWEHWDERGKAMWHRNCIDKGLDCSGGDLGNGWQLPGAAQPAYGWVHPSPRVPVPARS